MPTMTPTRSVSPLSHPPPVGSAAPAPTGPQNAPARVATTRQLREAERFAARYGRTTVRLDLAGYLRVDVFGGQSMPWITLTLNQFGQPVQVEHCTDDPREQGMKPTERTLLALLREDPATWHTVADIACDSGMTVVWTTVNVRRLAERGLLDVDERPRRAKRYRALLTEVAA